MEPAAERSGMFGAKDLGVRIVIEEAEILAPRHEHRKARLQQQPNHCS
jgi:hypothetical protein